MKTKVTGWGLLVVAALTAAACSGSEAQAPAPPGETASSVVATDDAVATSAAPDDTAPASTESDPVDSEAVDTTSTSSTTTTMPAPTTTVAERLLPEDLGPMTTSLPYDDLPQGVMTPGQFYEITPMQYVYLPDTVDTSEAGDRDVRPPTEEELPIIAAYARGIAAVRAQTSQFPVQIEPSEEMRAAFVDEGQAYAEGAFLARNQEGTYVGYPFDRPDINRPYVLTNPRSETEAVIFDCSFLSAVLLSEDGEIAFEGAEVYSREGGEARMKKVDGEWLVDTIVSKEIACE